MYTYWANVRTGVGSFMRVTVNANYPYEAHQMLLAMYGENLCGPPNQVF